MLCGETLVDGRDLLAGSAPICIDCHPVSITKPHSLTFRSLQSVMTIVEELSVLPNSAWDAILIVDDILELVV